MKQKRLKEILKLKLLLLCCLTLFWQCQDDFEESNVNVHELNSLNDSNVSYRMLTGKEARNKADLLNATISQSHSLDTGMAYRGTNENNNNGTIDYDNILEVIDTSGIANYTFKVNNHPDDSETVFHNLVLSDNGTEQKVTLVKYEYQNNATKMQNFEGKITARSLSSEEPCDETNIDGNLNTGTFSPSPEGGSNAGATYPDYPGSGTTNPSDTGNTGSSGSGSGGSGFLTVSDQPATFHCNSCNFSASSWEGYSGHTDGLGNIYDFTLIVNFGRMADLNPDPNPCDAGGTIGIIDDVEENDCEQLNGLKEKNGFTTKMTALKNNLTGTKEKGFTVRDIEGDEFSDIVTGDDDGNVDVFYGQEQTNEQIYRTVGAGHNHLQNNPDHIGIFTPEDLGPLLLTGLIETSENNPYTKPSPDKAFSFVITNKGYFLMKINDIQKLQTFVLDYKSWSLDKIKKYLAETFQNPEQYNIRPESTREELITGFLRFLQDKDIGAELYEGDSNTFDNVKKLTLSDNGNGNYSFNEEPCED